jgi:hypothetical protein
MSIPNQSKSYLLNVREGSSQNIYQMLRQLPQKKSDFPNLHHVTIRFTERGSPYDTLTRILPLQDKLQELSIHLDMQELGVSEIKNSLLITMNHREQGKDMDWFFDQAPS